MKPPPFAYHDPRNLDDALSLLAEKENAKVLAGGQSLMPMLNMRFVLPDDIIDLNGISDLAGIDEQNGRIHIGAMTRQRALERSGILAEKCPIIKEALRQVGHIQTRNRGTIGGSICHLDPSAELPTVASGLNATVRVASKRGTKTIPIPEFPAFYMTPSLEPDEIVTAVEFEPWQPGHGYAFVEFARRHGDFALVGVAVLIETEAKTVSRVSITLGGVGSAPIRCSDAETILLHSEADAATLDKAAETCSDIDAMDDVHVKADYRRHLAATLVRRAVTRAYGRATGAGT